MKKKRRYVDRLTQLTRPNPVSILLLACLTVLALVPLYLVLVNLFKESETIRSNPFGLPATLTLDNLTYVLTDPYKNIWQLYWNTILITVLGTLITVVLSAMLAYYIARHPGKKADFLFVFFIAAMSIPVMLLYVPLAYMLRFTGLNKAGIPVLVAIHVAFNVSFGMYIYSSFIKSLPRQVEEAAIIDGANSFQVFTKIILPNLKPATLTIMIFVGCAMWNDFLTPLLLGGGVETITTGIHSAIGEHTTDWARVFAYVFMSSMPTVAFFLMAQKHFIAGVTAGAVKG